VQEQQVEDKTMHEDQFNSHFAAMPIVAILRGLVPDEALDVGRALVQAGIRILEVPLNSPNPFKSIGTLAGALQGGAVVGAGTVLESSDVERVREAGGQIIVSPNMDRDVIRRTRELGMVSLPGCLTPTESFAALKAGAHAVKLFPGELVTPNVAKAMAAVLPKGTRLLVVGGVSADNIGDWRGSVVHGFGIGSSVFKPGMTANEVGERARSLVAAVGHWARSPS
jgi:2-dehydro-3-deoxyphosphogalactonate aldolase